MQSNCIKRVLKRCLMNVNAQQASLCGTTVALSQANELKKNSICMCDVHTMGKTQTISISKRGFTFAKYYCQSFSCIIELRVD